MDLEGEGGLAIAAQLWRMDSKKLTLVEPVFCNGKLFSFSFSFSFFSFLFWIISLKGR